MGDNEQSVIEAAALQGAVERRSGPAPEQADEIMMDATTSREDVPLILFGAFDRHNFGDLLFPHIISAMLPARLVLPVGLVSRDLRRVGGHRVFGLREVILRYSRLPVAVWHVGGEILTCDAWLAAVMLQRPSLAAQIVARLDDRPDERLAWAKGELHTDWFAPYVLDAASFPHALYNIFNAVGGVELDRCDPALQDEVMAKLKAATAVGVRDHVTFASLQMAGIKARLMPDCAVMVAELFGPCIRSHASRGEGAMVAATFPRGYFAVQFSADFGDDATLSALAASLRDAARAADCGVVFFRAGAAPWHDDLTCYRKIAARMGNVRTTVFRSLHIMAICALIAGSRLYCGSSLHGRIVASAFAVPRLTLLHPSSVSDGSKQAAYCRTWEPGMQPATCTVLEAAGAIGDMLKIEPAHLHGIASAGVIRYRQDFDRLIGTGVKSP